MLKSDISLIKKGLKKVNLKSAKTFYIKDGKVLKQKTLDLTDLGKDFCKTLVVSMNKSLTGGNSKIFAMDLKSEAVRDRLIEVNGEENIEKFIETNQEFFNYEGDVIVNVINFGIRQALKSENKEDAMEDKDEENDEERFLIADLFMVIVHKAEQLKEIGFSLEKNNFEEISTTKIKDIDVIIDFAKPLESFMFPIVEDEKVNINKVLYFTSKANKINGNITKKMLGCDFVLPPSEEKLLFNSIISQMFGTIPTKVLYSIYRKIHDRLSETNELINTKELQSLLEKEQFVQELNIAELIDELYGVDFYEFNIHNIIPDFTKKSLNIKNSELDIKVSPEVLSSLKSTIDEDGNKFIMIKIEDDIIVNELFVKEK